MIASRLSMRHLPDRAKLRCLYASNALHGERPSAGSSIGATVIGFIALAAIVAFYVGSRT